MRHEIFREDLEGFPREDAVILACALNAHQFFSDPALYLLDTESLINLTSEMDQPDSSLTQQAPEKALHFEQTSRRDALHQLSLVYQYIAELDDTLT